MAGFSGQSASYVAQAQASTTAGRAHRRDGRGRLGDEPRGELDGAGGHRVGWPISAAIELRYYAGASDPADASAWTGTGDVGTDTSTTIAGLVADTAYRVQVRARGDGQGAVVGERRGPHPGGRAHRALGGNDRPPAPRSATVDGRAVTVTFDRPLADGRRGRVRCTSI